MTAIIFLSGINMATFSASGLLFLKYYVASRDRFYLLFCLACWMLAIERVVLMFFLDVFNGVRTSSVESHSLIYLIRSAAFLLIVAAIISKNKKATFS